MDFSFFANGLFPFCSAKADNSIQYFNELIGNFIKDSVEDSCPLLKLSDSMKRKIYKGERPISRKSAKYLLNHIDKDKFLKWIGLQMEESDSWTDVQDWLIKNDEDIKGQYTNSKDIYPDDVCLKLFERILRNIVSSPSKRKDSLNRRYRNNYQAEI